MRNSDTEDNFNLINKTTMSEKSKVRRAKAAARQEKEGKNVIKWLVVCMVILAIAFMAYYMAVMA